jgi:hypothetical protein
MDYTALYLRRWQLSIFHLSGGTAENNEKPEPEQILMSLMDAKLTSQLFNQLLDYWVWMPQSQVPNQACRSVL